MHFVIVIDKDIAIFLSNVCTVNPFMFMALFCVLVLVFFSATEKDFQNTIMVNPVGVLIWLEEKLLQDIYFTRNFAI